jgi:hypothetical protein
MIPAHAAVIQARHLVLKRVAEAVVDADRNVRRRQRGVRVDHLDSPRRFNWLIVGMEPQKYSWLSGTGTETPAAFWPLKV